AFMELEGDAIKFIDNGAAPEFFADGLQDVQVIGCTCRFLLFQYRRSEGGVWIKEPVFLARLPIDAVGPAIALTLRQTGTTLARPAAAAVVRDLARSLVH